MGLIQGDTINSTARTLRQTSLVQGDEKAHGLISFHSLHHGLAKARSTQLAPLLPSGTSARVTGVGGNQEDGLI